MALIAINGTILDPQPAYDEWQETIPTPLLNGTDATAAYRTFTMRAPAIAGQTFNWVQFENQELTSFQTYAPGDLPTDTAVVYSNGVVAKKIVKFESPLDRSVTNIELVIMVNTEVGS